MVSFPGFWRTACLVAATAGVPAPAVIAAPQGLAPDPVLVVRNDGKRPRREIARASLPFARGELRVSRHVEVGGRVVPAVPLAHWSDGSVAVLQAHVPLALRPAEERRLAVRPVLGVPEQAWSGRWLWPDELPLHTEIEDPWGQVYEAKLVPDRDLHPLSSPLIRICRYRGVHRRGRAEFLGVFAYLTTFRGERRAELTLVLDNGAHLAGAVPLGPVRLRTFSLVTGTDRLRFRPRFVNENALHPPTRGEGGGFRQHLLGPFDQHYLGDRTAKAFRLDLFWDEAGATDADRTAALAAAESRLQAWPDLDWVRSTRAFGAHGGPAPAGLNGGAATWLAWRSAASFGPFTGHGDAEDAAAQGTMRNGPSALHNVLRWQSPKLLAAAETMVLQHCLRPTPGCVPREPAALEPFRQGLSKRAVARPHGFTPLDYEHFSVDLLYDYYWLTGDPLAREEIRRMGSGLRPLLAGLPFLTSRGEGWCAQAAVLIARATGDRGLVDDVLRRAKERVLGEIGAPPSPVALAQPGHVQAFGDGEDFDAPWQMAALVHGLHALYRATGDPAVAAAAVRTGRIMAGPGWLDGVGPKYLVSASGASRYILPVGFGPMEGTAMFEIGAFILASELTDKPAERELFLSRAEVLARANGRPESLDSIPWMQIYLDRWKGAR